MSDNINSNGWNQWSKHILMELERLNDKLESIDDRLRQVDKDLATLQIKAGFWGALAGSVPVLIVMVAKYLVG